MTNDRLSKILLYAFIATLIYLPLAFGSTRAMYAWPAEVMLQIITLGACWLFLIKQQTLPGSVATARIPLMLLGVFLALQLVLQYGFNHSIDRHATNEQLLKTLCLIEVFCLALMLIDSRSKLKLLVIALVLSGTFQAVYGTLMTVTDTDYLWNQPKEAYKGVATGTFVNRNHLAGYLEMTLALGIGLLIANLATGRANTWRQWLRQWTNTLLGEKARVRIYLALMVIGLILTQSRMGNTAFFVSMAIAGGLGLFLFRRSSRGVIILFSSLLIVDIFLMGTFFGIDELQKRIEKTGFETEQRLTVNELSIPAIEQNLLFGTGLGTWYTSFPYYRNEGITLFYDHAHSDLIEFPSELGLIGVLPLVLLLLHAMFQAIRVQIVRQSQFMRAIGFSTTMAIIAIAMHSSTDFNLQVPANAATFVLILALPYLATALDRRQTL